VAAADFPDLWATGRKMPSARLRDGLGYLRCGGAYAIPTWNPQYGRPRIGVAPQKQKSPFLGSPIGQRHVLEVSPMKVHRGQAGGLGRRLGTWASARSGIAQHGLLGGVLGHESSSTVLGTAPPLARSSAAACFLLVWLRADQARPYVFFPRAIALSRGPSGLIGWISAGSTREGESWFLVPD
jgi:hypothetical protein